MRVSGSDSYALLFLFVNRLNREKMSARMMCLLLVLLVSAICINTVHCLPSSKHGDDDRRFCSPNWDLCHECQQTPVGRVFCYCKDTGWVKNTWHQNCVYFSAKYWLIFTARSLEERSIAKASCPSIRPSVYLSVTLRYRDHIGWNSAKII